MSLLSPNDVVGPSPGWECLSVKQNRWAGWRLVWTSRGHAVAHQGPRARGVGGVEIIVFMWFPFSRGLVSEGEHLFA